MIAIALVPRMDVLFAQVDVAQQTDSTTALNATVGAIMILTALVPVMGASPVKIIIVCPTDLHPVQVRSKISGTKFLLLIE
jgi:hypothetical protein